MNNYYGLATLLDIKEQRYYYKLHKIIASNADKAAKLIKAKYGADLFDWCIFNQNIETITEDIYVFTENKEQQKDCKSGTLFGTIILTDRVGNQIKYENTYCDFKILEVETGKTIRSLTLQDFEFSIKVSVFPIPNDVSDNIMSICEEIRVVTKDNTVVFGGLHYVVLTQLGYSENVNLLSCKADSYVTIKN